MRANETKMAATVCTIIGERERANLVVQLAAIFLYIHTRRMHGIVGERERCVSLQKAGRKMRHDYPDAEIETERSVPHSLHRRKIVAALKLYSS